MFFVCVQLASRPRQSQWSSFSCTKFSDSLRSPKDDKLTGPAVTVSGVSAAIPGALLLASIYMSNVSASQRTCRFVPVQQAAVLAMLTCEPDVEVYARICRLG